MELRPLANLARFREIVTILFKYGFDDLVDRLDLPTFPFRLRVERADTSMTTGERIRCALQELGPTFIKFGQTMSLRPDVLPQHLIKELSKLQDDVAPVPFEMLRADMEDDLNGPIESVFSLFDSMPIAAASLSQVHRGILADTGEVVAVKIQRPNITSIIETDLNILEAIAHRIHNHYADLQIYDLPSLVALTRRTLRRELDFRREARNMTIARNNLGDMKRIRIPIPNSRLTTRRLLVMEYIHGKKLIDLTPGELHNREQLGRDGLQATLRQVLEFGFFHADPHPGNLLVSNGDKLCLLDWGMVGRLTQEDRELLLDLVKAVVENDPTAATDYVLAMTRADKGRIERRDLERDLMDILDAYGSIPLQQLSLGQLLMDVGAVLRTYRLRMPPNMFLMVKALAAAEQVGRSIYPELNVVEEAEPTVRRLSQRRYRPGAIWHEARNLAISLFRFNRNLPSQVQEIVSKLQGGDLSIRFEHENLEPMRRTLTDASQRLTLAIIIGSMIIGSSAVITVEGYSVIGIVGYILSGVIGLWLVYSVIRSTRRFR